MALVHSKVYAPDFPFSLYYSPSSPLDNRTQKIFSRKKRKRNKGDAGSSAEMMIDVIINAATDTVIDIIISSTQTLASSMDFNILLRINPRLLTGKVEIEG